MSLPSFHHSRHRPSSPQCLLPAFLESGFTRNFHCIATQCMTQFIRSGEVSIFTLYLFRSCVLLCLLNFSGLHTLSRTERQRESVMHTAGWPHILSGCHSCNRPKSDRCSVLVAVSLTAGFSLSFIRGPDCITARHLQTFNDHRDVQISLSFGAVLEGLL